MSWMFAEDALNNDEHIPSKQQQSLQDYNEFCVGTGPDWIHVVIYGI